MKTMKELFSRGELARLNRKRKLGVVLTCAALAAGLVVCIVLCCETTTANAARMERGAIVAGVVSGWLALCCWVLVATDAKREAGHAEMILAGERAAVPGRVTVTDERLRIRGSITIRKVAADNGKAVRKLNVNERKAKALKAAGEDITLYAVNGYVAAYETDAPDTATPRTPLQTRMLRKLVSLFPLFIVWLILGAMFWSWVFTFVTDTGPENKVTVFVDAWALEDTALAVELERGLPDGIRMVKVHPVSYVMFDESGFMDADLFIVRESMVGDYIAAFAPLSAAEGDCYFHEGVPYGVKLYDAATDTGPAKAYIQYSLPGKPAEDYYLFYGANSLHTGKQDYAAQGIIEQLMRLD